MEGLSARYTQLLRAYSRLDYMTKTFIQLSEQVKKSAISTGVENEFIVHRDALIQRFEFCYDLTWKFFKLVLKEKHSIDVTSPRKVFQECYQQGILTRDETALLTEMIDARNETSHVYDEAVADAISLKIVDYYGILAVIVEKIKPLSAHPEAVRRKRLALKERSLK